MVSHHTDNNGTKRRAIRYHGCWESPVHGRQSCNTLSGVFVSQTVLQLVRNSRHWRQWNTKVFFVGSFDDA